MLNNFLTVGEQVVILFLLIGVGFICGKTKLIGESGAKTMTNVVLYAVTPCIIIDSFQREFDSKMVINLLIMAACALGVHLGSILIATLVFREKEIAKRAVFRVATIFSNCGFMSLPLQKAILGDDGIFYGAVFVAMFNIFVWTYGLVAMSGSVKELSAKKLLFNPGLIGVTVAILLWVLNIQLPSLVGTPISYLASLNTPLPMLIIGYYLATANLKIAFTNKKSYLCMALRLVFIPLLSLGIMYMCGVRGTVLTACVIAASAPSAATTTMYSTWFNRDVSLSVSLVSSTTLISVITMPLIVGFAQLLA